ncbi:MAG: hypothetical protein RIM84_23695 [Alphaproteobacteria bacterium]
MSESSRRLTATWLPVLLLAVVQGAAITRNGGAVLNGELFGPDAYMRLNRVWLLLTEGDWFSSAMPRANVPYGDVLHWTRPFDILIAALAAPLALFTDLKAAIYWAGLFVSPILYFLSLSALYWAVRPLLDKEARFYLGFLFLFQLAILGQFSIGRPDHHGLLCLLFIVQVGQGLRLLADDVAPRTTIAAGLTTAAFIWVAPEGLVAGFLLTVAVGLFWLTRGGADIARRGLGHAIGAAVGIAVALLVERPPAHWLAIEHDKISAFHLLLFSLAAVFWVVATLPWRRWPTRLAVGAAGGLVVAAFVALLYPDAVAGPLAAVDPRVRELWFVVISEAQSPVDLSNPGTTARRMLTYLGPLIVAVPMLAWLIRSRDGAARRQWGLLALLLAAYVALALDELRWMYYPQVLFLPAYAAALMALLNRLNVAERPAGAGPGTVAGVTLARLGLILLFGAGFLTVAALFPPPPNATRSHSCDLQGVARMLNARPGLGDRPRRIMAFNFTGAEFIYRTGHGFVATPYHRNRQGILDGYDFFASTDLAVAKEIADRRGIDLVLFCPTDNEARMYRGGDAVTVFERLRDGPVPGWLRPLPVDPELGYLLFETAR